MSISSHSGVNINREEKLKSNLLLNYQSIQNNGNDLNISVREKNENIKNLNIIQMNDCDPIRIKND